MAITKSDWRWYTLALKVAEDSEAPNRHGCVLVRAGCVLSLATNRMSTHPISEQFEKRSIHAEQRAISRYGRSHWMAGATLYSARDHDNEASRPCAMCESLIRKAGISRVVYHNGDELEDLICD